MTDPVAGAVQAQLFPPGPQPNDAIIMFDGAPRSIFPWAKLTNGGWWAWDVRSVLLTFAHDLLRFQKPGDAKLIGTFNPAMPWGLRDQINRIHLLAEQDHQILVAIAAKTGTDISTIVSG